MARAGDRTTVFGGLLARRKDPYAGADLPSAQRVVGILLAFASLLTLALFALDPPSEQIGWPGWVVGGLLVVAGLGVAARLNQVDRLWSANTLLAVGYLGVAGIATLEWLSGSGTAAYDVLFIAWLGAGVVHPPRRSFVFLGTLLVGLALPLLYEPYSPALATRLAADALLIVAAGALLTIYLDIERARRVRMISAGRLAKVDRLTSLPNRRAFEQSLSTEVARAERSGNELSVALIDLDDFKAVNDGYGHLEGDRCLRELAEALERSVRAGDRCFRWAGDEFAALLPDTDHDGALQLLERVSEHVSATCERPDGRPLEISFGVSPAHRRGGRGRAAGGRRRGPDGPQVGQARLAGCRLHSALLIADLALE